MGDQVTQIALFKRLRPRLRAKGMSLRIASNKKQKRWGLGRYYLLGSKSVIDKDVDIENLARRLNLLRPWETLEK
jgi:hypothetical protein